MPSCFCLSIRFLDPAFHGRRDGNQPEWPPSPLRVFQSLVVAAARRRGVADFDALRWLEQQLPPVLIAPVAITAISYRLSVPNNAMDIVAKAWIRGNESNSGDASPAKHRTMKNIRPMLMMDGDAVHYLWPLTDPLNELVRTYVATLCDVARSIVALGWGIDMTIGHGAILSEGEAEALLGERWFPTAGGADNALRVPRQGTLNALEERHKGFLNRVAFGGFTPPPPLTAYETAVYRRGWDSRPNPVAAFALLNPDDGSSFRAFDTVRQALTVSGMLRHSTRLAAERTGWPKDCINACILGHGEPNGAAHVSVGSQRFAYLPLPSIEYRGEEKVHVVGSVRRGMLTTFTEGFETEMAWARRTLSGQELIDEDKKQAVALLSLVSASETIVRYYTQTAAAWATVTPVVLPGYDDPKHYRRRMKREISSEDQSNLLNRLYDRIDGLLRKSIIQAGFSKVMADCAEIEWRKVGFWPGTDLADRYGIPDHLKRFPRFHVRIRWRDAHNNPVEIPGPICLGGGRFYGLGLFAAC